MNDASAGFDHEAFERELRESAVAVGPEELRDAVTHVLQAGGKRMRPVLVHLFGRMVGGDPASLRHLALAVELLHTATLVHDDLIDRASTRRGQPVLHEVRGSEVALLVGDLYMARCGVHLSLVGDPRATFELFGALDVITRGELLQRERRFDLAQSQADYLATIDRKTGSLVAAACSSAIQVSGGSDELVSAAREYGRRVGLAFQVVDDVLDYVGDAGELGKPVGNDIREGTVTLPLILALESRPHIRALVELARASGNLGDVIAAVRDSGSAEKSLEIASGHALRAVEALGAFPASESRDAAAAVAEGMVARRS